MRIIAKLKEVLTDSKDNALLTLKIDNFIYKKMVKELDQDKTYSVEIKEVKSKRSIEQNKLMWELLHEIDIAVNGKPTDEYEFYCMALERANAKFEYIGCTPEAEGMLKEQFRAVRYVSTLENGMNLYKVYIGSSKMNTKEMSLLIDTILDIASEIGIEVGYWQNVLQ